MSDAKVVWDQTAINNIKRNFMTGLVKMGTDMENRGKFNAPYLTGALRSSIRVVEDSSAMTVNVIAGGFSGRFNIDYAEKREFENKKNPSTKYYMTRAFNSVVSRGIESYFKGLV